MHIYLHNQQVARRYHRCGKHCHIGWIKYVIWINVLFPASSILFLTVPFCLCVWLLTDLGSKVASKQACRPAWFFDQKIPVKNILVKLNWFYCEHSVITVLCCRLAHLVTVASHLYIQKPIDFLHFCPTLIFSLCTLLPSNKVWYQMETQSKTGQACTSSRLPSL